MAHFYHSQNNTESNYTNHEAYLQNITTHSPIYHQNIHSKTNTLPDITTRITIATDLDEEMCNITYEYYLL